MGMTRIQAINAALKLTWTGGGIFPAAIGRSICENTPARQERDGSIKLSPDLAVQVRRHLQASLDLHEDAMTVFGWKLPEKGSRADYAGLIGNEKIYAGKVTQDRDNQSGVVWFRPQGPRVTSFGWAAPDVIAALRPAGIILVENWETFRDFHLLDFPIPACWQSFLVVSRGSGPDAPQNASEAALRLCGCPVIVFPDYDPAGLIQAAAVPNMKDILWPGEERLNALCRQSHASGFKFTNQIGGNRDKLDKLEHPTLRRIWAIIKANGQMPAQEIFHAKR